MDTFKPFIYTGIKESMEKFTWLVKKGQDVLINSITIF